MVFRNLFTLQQQRELGSSVLTAEPALHRGSIEMHQTFAACTTSIYRPDGTRWKQDSALCGMNTCLFKSVHLL